MIHNISSESTKRLIIIILTLCAYSAYADIVNSYYARNTLRYELFGDNTATVRGFASSSLSNPVVIPSSITVQGRTYSVTSIGDWAFYDCSSLASVDIPNSVTSIGEGAFHLCTSLTSVVIPNSVTSIGSQAFSGCDFTSINIPNSVTYIGDAAFSGCSSLTSVVIPNSVTAIGNWAFDFCRSLTSVDIPNSVTAIGDWAFAECYGLTSIVIPNSVTAIGNWAFDFCRSLTSVDIPNSVTSIGEGAFDYCRSLTSVDIPNSVTSIGRGAFINCFSLSSINIHRNTPPSTSSSIFSNNEIQVHVPCGAANVYYADIRWSQYQIIDDLEYTLNAISSDSSRGSVFIDTIPTCDNGNTASLSAIPTTHHRFDHWSDGNTDNPRQITLVKDTVLSAYFVLDSVWVEVNSDNPYNGYVEGGGYHLVDDEISIRAIPLLHYHFDHWSDGNTDNPRNVIVRNNVSLTAFFVTDSTFVSLSSNDTTKGRVEGGGWHFLNEIIILQAVASESNHFLRWSDGDTQNPRPLSITNDTTFVAYFVSNQSTIEVYSASTTMGTVFGGGIYQYMEQANIIALPNYGYHFVQWNDGNTENPRVVVVDQDVSFTAFFALSTYSISITSNDVNRGSVTGSGQYTHGEQVVISATPSFGYHFTQWSDGTTMNPRSFTAINDTVIMALFECNRYSVSVLSDSISYGYCSGSGTFDFNSSVDISAIPLYGYHFVRWSDGSTENPRSITITQDTSFMAVFSCNTYTITATSISNTTGVVLGGGAYNYQAMASIIATPSLHYHFVRWDDGSVENPRNIRVTQDSSFTAIFEIDTHSVYLTSANLVYGTVSGNCSAPYGTILPISAAASYGYHFTHWNDGNTDNPRLISLLSDTAFIAHFDLNTYSVNVQNDNLNRGNVIGTGNYDYLSNVMLTAIPNYGYHFSEWEDGSTTNPRNITIVSDTTLGVHFVENIYTVNTNSNIDSCVVSGAGSYPYLSSVNLSVSAYPHYHFVRWSDENTNNPRTLALQSDTSLTAFIALDTHYVSLGTDVSQGVVSESGWYAYNSQIIIEATPNIHYHFDHWSDGSISNPRIINVVCDTTISAIFALDRHSITALPSNENDGSVTGGGIFDYGSIVTLTASPTEHHHFSHWSDGVASNPRNLTVTSDTLIIAQFVEDPRYLIQVNNNNSNMGTTTGSGSYYMGDTIAITAIPYDHYQFVEWSDGVMDNPREVIVIADATYTAVFEASAISIVVTQNNPSWGGVEGGGIFGYGDMVNCVARAYSGYHFIEWDNGSNENPYLFPATEDLILTAIFGEDEVGIDDVGMEAIIVHSQNHTIIIQGAHEGNVRIYDIMGRQVFADDKCDMLTKVHVESSGIYIVKVGDTFMTKVFVK